MERATALMNCGAIMIRIPWLAWSRWPAGAGVKKWRWFRRRMARPMCCRLATPWAGSRRGSHSALAARHLLAHRAGLGADTAVV